MSLPPSDPPEAEAGDALGGASDPGPGLPGMAPASGADAQTSYTVLARKYRPQTFEDMVGQDAMVRVLTNAFRLKRVAHAFMLTGVRGVGKTTTARLLARALNYMRDGGPDEPSLNLSTPGIHCEAIAKGSHPDVMEMDAASRTGVGDIREILDGVRYAPVVARHKVYIIDEVHMLSTAAFNALLKTLEEPPSHAKFIFATTEIRKVPITVLSRCQRFDLKRVEPEVLIGHLESICEKEAAPVAEDGLRLIARAAEGSVRDALSLLDQAIVLSEAGKETSAEAVRDMLGLADRSRTLDILRSAMTGNADGALSELRRQYDAGADPVIVLRDCLDHCHALTRARALGSKAQFTDASDYVEAVRSVADQFDLPSLARLWQMLLKGYQETREAPHPLQAAEMALLRLVAAADLPSPEAAKRALDGQAPAGPAASATRSGDSRGANPGPSAQHRTSGPPLTMMTGGRAAALRQPIEDRDPEDAVARVPDTTGVPEPALRPAITCLEDIVTLAEDRRQALWRHQIERYVRPVSVRRGSLVFHPTADMPESWPAQLARQLAEWTDEPWAVEALASPNTDVEAEPETVETLAERKLRERRALIEAIRSDPTLAPLFNAFPDAQIVEVESADGTVILPRSIAASLGANRNDKET